MNTVRDFGNSTVVLASIYCLNVAVVTTLTLFHRFLSLCEGCFDLLDSALCVLQDPLTSIVLAAALMLVSRKPMLWLWRSKGRWRIFELIAVVQLLSINYLDGWLFIGMMLHLIAAGMMTAMRI